MTVEGTFDGRDVSVFKTIGDVDGDIPCIGISLLHSRRILCYRPTNYIPYEYNVDTGENERIDIEQRMWFSSSMEIGCSVEGVFQDEDNRFIYTLDWDNKVAPLY